MLLVYIGDCFNEEFVNKYKESIVYLLENVYNFNNKESVINYLQEIKTSLSKYEITVIVYNEQIIQCLNTLNIKFTLVYNLEHIGKNINLFNKIRTLKCNKWIVSNNTDIQYILNVYYKWIELPKFVEENVQELTKEKQEEIEEVKELVEKSTIPENKNKLTLQQLLDEDIEITEADVRDLKATQNKLKVGMLLQAKASLNRVLKLSNILDKLYDNLLDRIDNSMETTDTASLLYTTDYIAKALNDTNQFIVSLISNEKIQNFFIIENNNVINVTDEKIDIAKRERIRKAAEIVMNNLDYFVEGDFNKIQDPNVIEVNNEEGGTDNVDIPT